MVLAHKVARRLCMIEHLGNPFFLCETTAWHPPVAPFIFNGSTKWFPYWTSIFILSMIPHPHCSLNHILGRVLSVFSCSLSWNSDDEVHITLQYLKWLLREISLHCGITSLVVTDKVKHRELSNALARVKSVCNLFFCGTGDNKKLWYPLHWHRRYHSLALCDSMQILF